MAAGGGGLGAKSSAHSAPQVRCAGRNGLREIDPCEMREGERQRGADHTPFEMWLPAGGWSPGTHRPQGRYGHEMETAKSSNPRPLRARLDFLDYVKLVKQFYQTGEARLADWDVPEATD